MGFGAGPVVLRKNGCRLEHTFWPKKCFPPTPPPLPQMCSHNDQRDVGITLSRRCWGRPPPPARQVGHPPPPTPPPPPARWTRRWGWWGWANGPPCHRPPPSQSNFQSSFCALHRFWRARSALSCYPPWVAPFPLPSVFPALSILSILSEGGGGVPPFLSVPEDTSGLCTGPEGCGEYTDGAEPPLSHVPTTTPPPPPAQPPGPAPGPALRGTCGCPSNPSGSLSLSLSLSLSRAAGAACARDPQCPPPPPRPKGNVRSAARRRRRGGVWHKASASDCLPLAAPIGLSPLLILTLCGPERVLVVSTEPPDDLSCLTTPGVGRPRDGAVARAVDQVHPDAHSESMRGFADSSTDLSALGCASAG